MMRATRTTSGEQRGTGLVSLGFQAVKHTNKTNYRAYFGPLGAPQGLGPGHLLLSAKCCSSFLKSSAQVCFRARRQGSSHGLARTNKFPEVQTTRSSLCRSRNPSVQKRLSVLHARRPGSRVGIEALGPGFPCLPAVQADRAPASASSLSRSTPQDSQQLRSLTGSLEGSSKLVRTRSLTHPPSSERLPRAITSLWGCAGGIHARQVLSACNKSLPRVYIAY